MKLFYGRMMADRLDGEHGLPRPRLVELARRFGEVQAEVRRRRSQGEYGFYGLGSQAAAVQTIRGFAEGVGQAFDHVLVLGIGGSALGMKALLNALRRPAWYQLDDEGRGFFPRCRHRRAAHRAERGHGRPGRYALPGLRGTKVGRSSSR